MLSQRLGQFWQQDPDYIRKLIAYIKENPGSCDEIWFTSYYGYPPVEKHAATAKLLGQYAEDFRNAGIRVSMQVANTIGHGAEKMKYDCTGLVYDGSPAERIVGHDGTVAVNCFCWRGKVFRQYMKDMLSAYVSEIHPHTVWLDDDTQPMHHDPVNYGCFCEDCIQAFNATYDASFTGEELVKAINEDLSWRRKHMEFVKKSMYDFVYELGEVIHEIDPECGMGLQYGMHGAYAGFGFQYIFDAMLDSTHIIPKSRPGGGVYDDYTPSDFLAKGEILEYGNYMLPDYVTDKRPEVENLYDVVYGKSIGGTCFETTYYLASGNNAMSYATMMSDYEDISWHGQMLAAFASHRAYWEKLCRYNDMSYPTGLKPYFTENACLAKTNELFGYNKEDFRFAMPFRYRNIPVATTKKDMPVYLLSSDTASILSEEEVQFLIGKPVLTDSETLHVLNDRGFDIGADAEQIDIMLYNEVFTDHPANGNAKGRKWGGNYHVKGGWALKGTQLEVVGQYQSRNCPDTGLVASGIFTTPAGAKWFVPYGAWGCFQSAEKRNQLLNGLAYISGTRFAAELVTPIKAILMPRINDAGKTVCVSVTNVTLGPSGELKLIIRNPNSLKMQFMSQYQDSVYLDAEPVIGEENAYCVKIPNICTWSVGTVFCE